jgi:hypothetical protein
VGGDPALAWAIGAALGMPVALLVVRARRRRRERP